MKIIKEKPKDALYIHVYKYYESSYICLTRFHADGDDTERICIGLEEAKQLVEKLNLCIPELEESLREKAEDD